MKIITFFTDLAISYEQKEQFNEAVNMWRTIIGICQHINKIPPLVSMIDCLLKIGELDEAVVSCVELVSLLETTADQVHPIIEECDLGIHNLVEKFLKLRKFNVIFQLLQCRFKLLKRHYNEEDKFDKLSYINVLMMYVAEVGVVSSNEIESFTEHHGFLDDILLFLKDSPVTSISLEVARKNVATFLYN